MSRLVLRNYQEAAVQAHFDFFEQNREGHPLFVMPTGSGKSLTIAEFIRLSIETWPKTRVLVLTHVKELIEQNYAEFIRNWNDESIFPPCGIYSAGIGRRDTSDSVLFAGIQSIYKRAEELGWFDLVLVDEAHLCPKKGMGRYRSYLDDLTKINPHVRVCGYTATHYRMDGGYLHKGEGRIFTDVAYDVPLETLIDGEYLVPLVSKAVEHRVDTSGVVTVRGDFKMSQLEEAAIEVVNAAVDEAVELAYANDRHHWLWFGAGVEHARMISDRLEDHHGVPTGVIFGDTPKDAREDLVHRFREGDLKSLANYGVLTTGFNAPRVDMMAIMRPTQSTGLYVQMMGRGMRTFPGKSNCLVLDYGENVARHGPINAVKPKVEGKGEPAPTKVCPECASIVLLAARECDCGYLWPFEPPVRKHTLSASSAAPYDPGASANAPRRFKVDDVMYARHQKKDRPDSLRVDYRCGLRRLSDWVCLEHGGFPGRKAARWWTDNGGQAPIPLTVSDAIHRLTELRVPSALVVIDDGGYDRVTRTIFEEVNAT